MNNITFTFSELIAGFMTILGLSLTAYGLYVKYQERKNSDCRENTENTMKFVEIDNNLKNLSIQQMNIISVLGEYKTKIESIIEMLQNSKYQIRENSHLIEMLKQETDAKIKELQKEQASIEARLGKANIL